MLKVDVFKVIKLEEKKKRIFTKITTPLKKRKNKQGVAIPTQVFKTKKKVAKRGKHNSILIAKKVINGGSCMKTVGYYNENIVDSSSWLDTILFFCCQTHLR